MVIAISEGAGEAPPGGPRSQVREGFWESPLLWLALALASALPFLVAPFPMLPDWFSHVGRYEVMLHGGDDPWLARYYAFRWSLIGNLGVDLLMVPLGPLLGVERAAHLIAALIPPATLGGIFVLSRAAWGRVAPGALLAASLAYAMTFTLGFLNFCLAQALAFWLAAGWIRLARCSAALRWCFGLAAGAVAWLAHMAGWGMLLVIVGGWEVAAARRAGKSPLAAARALPLAAPLVPTLLWRTSGAAAAAPSHPYDAGAKLLWIENLFRSEVRGFDLVSTAAVLAGATLMLALLLRRRAEGQPALLLAAAALGAAFLVLPQWLFESYYADMRMLPAALILLLIGIRPDSRRLGVIMAAAGLALFAGRVLTTTAGWHARGAALAQDLAVLNRVPVGSRIAVAAYRSACVGWTPSAFDHAPSLAIVRRRAFVNTEFDYAGSHLLRPLYNAGRGFNGIPSNLVAGPRWPCDGRPLADLLEALPLDRFDYVWTFEVTPPAGTDWLEPVAAGPAGHLYRIRKG